MSAVFPAFHRSPPAARAGSVRASRPLAWRIALLLGIAASTACAYALSNPAAASVLEPELALLLRGMAVIKASITLAAIAILYWRFGRPIAAWAAGAYLGAVWLLAGANVLIWQLTAIPAAAIAFHIGMFGLLAIAWREERPRLRWLQRGA